MCTEVVDPLFAAMFLTGDGHDDDFEGILEKLSVRHYMELSRLKSEISRLQTELEASRSRILSRNLSMQEELVLDTGTPKISMFKSNPTQAVSSSHAGVELEAFADVSSKIPNHRKPYGLAFMNVDSQPSFSTAVMARVLRHPCFDVVMCTVIFLNTIVFAFEAQYRGLMLEGLLGFKGASPRSEETYWLGAEDAFDTLELFFGIIYTVEVVFKVCVLGRQFCLDAWNWIDTAIVASWLVSKVIGQAMVVNSQVLRLVRMFRLMRLLKLVRRIQQFDHLFMMTTAIRGSFGILAWTSAVLFLVHMLLALLVQQSLFYFYFGADGVTIEDKNQIFEYFGTFTRSLLTFFELTLANFAVPTRIMVEKVNDWCMVFCILHKLTVGFAVVGVINGVLMQETFKVAQADDLVMLRTRQKAVATHVDKMRQFFEEADTSKDGRIDFEEFQTIMQNKEVKIWLSAMELDVRDVRQLFDLLDRTGDSDGTLSAEELVLGIAKLRGPARSIDINAVMFHQEKFEEALKDMKLDLQRLNARSGKKDRLQTLHTAPSSLMSSKDDMDKSSALQPPSVEGNEGDEDVGLRI